MLFLGLSHHLVAKLPISTVCPFLHCTNASIRALLGTTVHSDWLKRQTCHVLYPANVKQLLTKYEHDISKLCLVGVTINNEIQAGQKMALPVFASSIQHPEPELFSMCFVCYADSLHCALFPFQWSLFFLSIPQFVIDEPKHTDTGGGEKSQTNISLMTHCVFCVSGKRKTMLCRNYTVNIENDYLLTREWISYDMNVFFKSRACLQKWQRVIVSLLFNTIQAAAHKEESDY